jgi:hypothetical protein
MAAVLGALQISSDASNAVASGQVQHLAGLNAAVVRLTQDLEDERDLSAAYAARRQAGPVPVALASARTTTDAAARIVRADTAGIGAGYQPSTVQALHSLLASLTDLGDIRAAVSSAAWPASQVVASYTSNVIAPASTFSAAIGAGTSDARLPSAVTTSPRCSGWRTTNRCIEPSVRRAERATARARSPGAEQPARGGCPGDNRPDRLQLLRRPG